MKLAWGLPLLVLVNLSQAQLKLPKIFGDSMVLQRNQQITIWGWAIPNEAISVGFHNQKTQTRADAAGKWKAVLKPESAGGPYDLSVKGKTGITLKGILVGDIWLCSGQSNMEMPLKGWGTINNADEEIANANYPSIRLFTVEKNVQGMPVDDVKGGQWQTCTSANIPPFSAVGYFFGRALNQQLKVPIGLINSTWGGTNIESWISYAGFQSEPYYQPLVKIAPQKPTDELTRKRAEADKKYVAIVKIDQTQVAKLAQWKDADYADAGWPEMKVPGIWDKQQPGTRFDGIIWFRKELNVDEAGEGVLSLGKIDDNDETYVNGVKVGSTNDYSAERSYKVNLQKGKNVIAVKIEDTGGEGGFYSEKEKLVLTVGDKTYPLYGNWKFQVQEVKKLNFNVGPNDYPYVLYNGMIHPIEQLAIKGVIWYQGESNANRAIEYRKAMPLLIKDWRDRYKEPNMPFYFVQLASFRANNGNSERGSKWAELREAQALTAATVPNSGFAVTTDIGDAGDIHPRNKQDVGKRLAAIALEKTYGIKTVALSPEYKKMAVKNNQAIIEFTNKNLAAKSDIKGFEIAGADQKFHPARAVIEGNAVVVSSPDVQQPVAVRYAWADDASEANLFNKDGFPVAPFRTDKWKAATENEKYSPTIIY